MSDKQQFGEHYRRLADDELARLALENHLVADAKEALADELKRRKISDLSEYKKALDEPKAQRTAARELQFQSNGLQQFRLWALVCIAWLLAVAGPFHLRSQSPRLQLPEGLSTRRLADSVQLLSRD